MRFRETIILFFCSWLFVFIVGFILLHPVFGPQNKEEKGIVIKKYGDTAIENEALSKKTTSLRSNSAQKSNNLLAQENTLSLSYVKKLYELGERNPSLVVRILDKDDPFGVKAIDPHKARCPSSPEEVIGGEFMPASDSTSIFRASNGVEFNGSFIFYQHVRKAGGTGFCDLARRNMKRAEVPPYYCMPDRRGSLVTPPYDQTRHLADEMASKGYRVAANEWDVYYKRIGGLPGVVLATTLRDPLDRWYSQYRFEHLEHRDGSSAFDSIVPFKDYYNGHRGWAQGDNYYVKTFYGEPHAHPEPRNNDFYWSFHKYRFKKVPWEMFLSAIHNLRSFHLVLVLEWMSYFAPVIERELGWTKSARQVLPHESQNVRGNKTSPSARQVLSSYDLNFVLDLNWQDLLFYHLARRMALDKHFCHAF